eukprot:Lithocolla_globosa_v1_NODE_3505_length_1652_cov_10.362555.p2 type:complete len:130 gc:universal NODE_3505_length_1652_cov_10.362555:1179-1568(+)
MTSLLHLFQRFIAEGLIFWRTVENDVSPVPIPPKECIVIAFESCEDAMPVVAVMSVPSPASIFSKTDLPVPASPKIRMECPASIKLRACFCSLVTATPPDWPVLAVHIPAIFPSISFFGMQVFHCTKSA